MVSFYNQIRELRQKDSLAAILDTVERLPEMSKEELQEVSDRGKKFMSS